MEKSKKVKLKDILKNAIIIGLLIILVATGLGDKVSGNSQNWYWAGVICFGLFIIFMYMKLKQVKKWDINDGIKEIQRIETYVLDSTKHNIQVIPSSFSPNIMLYFFRIPGITYGYNVVTGSVVWKYIQHPVHINYLHEKSKRGDVEHFTAIEDYKNREKELREGVIDVPKEE